VIRLPPARANEARAVGAGLAADDAADQVGANLGINNHEFPAAVPFDGKTSIVQLLDLFDSVLLGVVHVLAPGVGRATLHDMA
jgi:hypothetical protein